MVPNRLDEAVSRFKRALSLDPRFAPAQYHLSLVYWIEDDEDRSIPYLQTAAALEPENGAYTGNSAEH